MLFIKIVVGFFFVFSIITFFVVSSKPSAKHGNNLKEIRESIMKFFSGLALSKAISTSSKIASKSFATKLKGEEQKPVYNQKPQKEKQVQQINTPKAGRPASSNDAENAPFFYDTDNADPSINCGKWRIGDTYIDENGKEQYVRFELVPYTYKGKLYLGIEYPHVQEMGKSEQTYYDNGEPTYWN